jgi:type IV secretory pathway VirB2 component (pilin)
MNQKRSIWPTHTLVCALWVLCAVALPEFALAQAMSPFDTGANSLVTSLTTLATPIAVLLVMALGVAAAAGQISWGWPLGVLAGIGLIFAAPTMVTWVKSLFGV